MATTEERMKILQMIQEGKISAEDGAKLLSALTNSAASVKLTPVSVSLNDGALEVI